MSALTTELLRTAWPHAKPELINGVVNASDQLFATYGITSWLRFVHFMAQISEESGGGTITKESLYYTTPKRVHDVWPSRFPSLTSAVPYLRNERKLADKVYNGRMGNSSSGDDGFNFRGRGLLQLTGKSSYDSIGNEIGMDLISNPDLAFDPSVSLKVALHEFKKLGCLPFCDRDDVRGVTHRVNGGYTNLTDRQSWLARWKRWLPESEWVPPSGKEAPHENPPAAEPIVPPAHQEDAPIAGVKYGDHGWEVTALQRQLNTLNYKVGTEDGDFGASTRAALLAFQADNALPTTGILDAPTKLALTTSPPKPVSEARQQTTEKDLAAKGSETIQAATNVRKWGWWMLGLGGASGAEQSGAIDQAKTVVQEGSSIRDVVTAGQDLLHWVQANIWIVIAIAAVLVLWQARNIIKSRLADHQNGTNMGR